MMSPALCIGIIKAEDQAGYSSFQGLMHMAPVGSKMRPPCLGELSREDASIEKAVGCHNYFYYKKWDEPTRQRTPR